MTSRRKPKNKSFKFRNMDGDTWRTVGKDVRRSLDYAAAVAGMDEIIVGDQTYNLQSDADIQRAVDAIERLRRFDRSKRW